MQVRIPSAAYPPQIFHNEVSVTGEDFQADPEALRAGSNPILLSVQSLLLQPWKPRVPH